MKVAFLLTGVITLTLCTTDAAHAQVVPAASPPGITVAGRGVVRVHADSLRFIATLTTLSGRGATSATPAADVDVAAQAIVTSLRDAGVSDAAAGSSGFNPSAPRTVTGTLRRPTREAVGALLMKGNAAAAPFPSVVLQNINFGLLVDDCAPAQTRAEAAALADARARAQRTALAAGVRLGSIVAINEAPTIGSSGSFYCATRPDTQINNFQNFGPLRTDGDDAMNGDVFVSVIAIVTFSIQR